MQTRAIAGGAILWLGLAWAPSASAEIFFLSGASHVDADASASAGGAAYATGTEAAAHVSMTSSSGTQTSSLDQGLGGSTSAGLGQAQADFAGVSKSITTTAGVDAYESLAALASDYQDMRVEFASPSSASFFFSGDASASFSGMGVTSVSTPTTTTTVVTDVPSSRTDRRGTLAKRPLRIAVAGPSSVTGGRRSSLRPSAAVEGYAGAQAGSDNSYTYTFEALGDIRQTLTIAYATSALIDGPVTYELSLINATTGARVGPARWIDAISDGEDSWSLRQPGVYSLIVSEFSHVSAVQDFGDMQSQGAFQMSIFAGGPHGGLAQASVSAAGPPRTFQIGAFAESWSPDVSATSAPAAVPELPAWMLLLIGLAGLHGCCAPWRPFRSITGLAKAVVMRSDAATA